MSRGQAEWMARADECRRESRLALEASAKETTVELKVQHLLLATELLKLADAIEQQLSMSGDNQTELRASLQ